MEEQMCKNCTYYRQHYGLDNERIFRVFCGHCVFGSPKRKRPYNTCENFMQKESTEDGFVSKAYLSKELLRYMMELELFPGIEDALQTEE